MTGVYVLLTRRHVLIMLLGGELLLHAAALNFMVFGGASADVQFVLLCLISTAVVEVVLILALSVCHYKLHGTMHIDLFRTKNDDSAHV